MREIFTEIKRHGDTSKVKFWPGYLMHCVQQHWQKHWEDYYNEAKAVQNIANSALVSIGRIMPASDRVVESLALAHNVLTRINKTRRAKRSARNDLAWALKNG